MTIKQAIKVLKRANKWRRGGKGNQPDPKEFGEAIDVAIVMLDYYSRVDPESNRLHVSTEKLKK